MSRLNPHAETLIFCAPFRDAPEWCASGGDRADAESVFATALLSGMVSVPAYRVVAQYKVDQYDGPTNSETLQ